jgi:hypothetical protein
VAIITQPAAGFDGAPLARGPCYSSLRLLGHVAIGSPLGTTHNNPIPLTQVRELGCLAQIQTVRHR